MRPFALPMSALMWLICLLLPCNAIAQVSFENSFPGFYELNPNWTQLKARTDSGYSTTSYSVLFPDEETTQFMKRDAWDQDLFYWAHIKDSNQFGIPFIFRFHDFVELPPWNGHAVVGHINFYQSSTASSQAPWILLDSPPSLLHDRYNKYNRGQNLNLHSFHAISVNSDSSFNVAGEVLPDSANGYDGGFFQCRLEHSSNGHLEPTFTQVHVGGQYHKLQDVVPMEGGGFVYGSFLIDSTQGIGSQIMVTDSLGIEQWSHFIPNAGIVAVGSGQDKSVYFTLNGPGSVVAKLDSNGVLLWSRMVGDTSFLTWNDVVETADGGVAVCGSVHVFGQYRDRCMVKLDNNGQVDWAWSYPSPPLYFLPLFNVNAPWFNREAFKMDQSPDQGFFIASRSSYVDFNLATPTQVLDVIKTFPNGQSCSASPLQASSTPFPITFLASIDSTYQDTVFGREFHPPFNHSLSFTPPQDSTVCFASNCNLQVNISATTDSVCTGDTISFFNTASNPATTEYKWGYHPTPGIGGTGPILGTDSFLVLPTSISTLQQVWLSASDSATGCTTTASYDFNQLTMPNPGLGQDTLACSPDSVLLSGTPGMNTYLWSSGTMGSSDLVPAPGAAWLEVTDAFGCRQRDSIVISVDTFIADLGPDTLICPGSQITLSPGAGANSYQWQNGSPTASLLVGPGTYHVTVTSPGTCVYTNTIQIGSFSLPSPSLGDVAICEGDIQPANAGPGFSSYLWSTGDTIPSLNLSMPGLYWVEATDTFGCNIASRDSFVLSWFPSVPVNLGTDTALCIGDSLLLTAGPNYQSYMWNNGNNTAELTAQTPGWYGLTVVDSFGCTLSDSMLLSQAPNPIAAFSYTATGTSIQFTNLTTGASSAFWQFGDGDSSTTLSPTHTYPAGSFTPCLIATSGQGCSDTICQSIVLVHLDPAFANQWQIYPQPAQGQLIIQSDWGLDGWSIVDLQGRKLMTGQLNGAFETRIPLEHLANGIYLLQVWGNQGTGVKKMVIRR